MLLKQMRSPRMSNDEIDPTQNSAFAGSPRQFPPRKERPENSSTGKSRCS
jgi:hypothetical protein